MIQSTNTPVTEVQTSTTNSGKVELGGSDSALSFDELDEITQSKKRAKLSTKDKEEKSDTKAEKADSKEPGSKDLTTDDKKAKDSDPKAKKEESPKEQSKAEADQEAADLKQLRKTLKAKLEDKEFDLDEGALVPVTINGKEELVPIKELLGNYSGKVAWDKRFTEVSKKEKAAQMRELKLHQAAESFKAAMSEQDPDVRIFKMAQMAGANPIEYRQKFLDDNLNLLEKYYSMSEHERKADALEFENKFYKHRADTLEGSMKAEQAKKALSAKLEALRASHQVSEDEFTTQYQQVAQFVEAGDIDAKQLTPEFIIETIQKDRLWKAVETSLQNLELPWNTEQRGQKILDLVEKAHQVGLKPEDMAEVVDETWGIKKAQRNVQKYKDERQEHLSGKKPVSQAASKTNEPAFFDEII